MSIDPRLMERRRTVAEHKAKTNVARLLKFLGFCVVAGTIVWTFFSPWLSVGEVETTGVDMSSAHSILVEHGVVAGTPMISIRAGAAETALLDDPWVAEAEVTMHWPDLVSVTVVERVPVAWVDTSGGWARRAIDGVAVPSDRSPDDQMARIEMPGLQDEEAVDSVELAGALEFVEALPSRRHAGTVIRLDNNELWATVAGYQVRLGRAVEMREKARALEALLAENLPEESLLILVAPTNPAHVTPTSDDAGQAEGTTP